MDADFDLVLDFQFTTSDAKTKIVVIVDTSNKYTLACDGATHANITIPINGYSGSHQLRIQFTYVSVFDPAAGSVRIDNLRVQNPTRTDVYVNTSTGNDSYAGDSCAAGHPKATFQAAYNLCKSNGSSIIHCCNDGADFSGETVTLNKPFSIDRNGSSGYFYMPQAS